jgi:transposase-like protein
MEGRVTRERRRFTREFKLEALRRFSVAGDVRELARELGIRRELLYKWREKFAQGGAEALTTSGRPRPAAEAPEAMASEKKIAELERKLGQQALELDFFRGALRRIEASRRPSEGPGVTASSPRSRP